MPCKVLGLVLLLFALSQAVPAQKVDAPLLPVELNGRCGYIDRNGRVVIGIQYHRCWKFSEGFASVSLDGKLGFIDPEGNYLVTPQFSMDWWLVTFREGYAPVTRSKSASPERKEERGMLDAKGHVTYLPGVTFLEEFREGLAIFERDGRKGYLDTSLKVAIEPRFKSCGHFYEGRAQCETLEGKEYFIDRSGRTLFLNRDGGDFHDGLAFFKSGGKYGFIDPEGKVLIEPKFDGAGHFAEGLAAAKVGSRWGFIDRNGELVIEPRFDYALVFSEGLASVAIDGKYGFIDKTGTVVIPLQFDYWTRWFENGSAQVHLDGKMGYVDKLGNYIWRPTK